MATNNEETTASRPGGLPKRSLAGKVALVLGLDDEPDRQLIRSLAERGADTVFVCVSGVSRATLNLKQEIAALNRRCLIIVASPTSQGFAQRILAQTGASFSHVDLFIDLTPREERTLINQNALWPNLGLLGAALGEIVGGK